MNKANLWAVVALYLLSIAPAFSQSTDSCKVLLKKISGEYKGKCHNGLANGKGTAKGEDTYIGFFKNGLPDGKGKYIYKNGNVYTGYWKNGRKDGRGKFKYFVNGKMQVLQGYWKNGEYVGTNDPNVPYRVTASSGIMQYEFRKVKGNTNKVTIYTVSAMTKFVPPDLRINISSGKILQVGKTLEIHNFFVPLNCDINYTIEMGAERKQCHFMFDIYEKGSYEIILHND